MAFDEMGLPWSLAELQALAERLVEHGEAPKVDLKTSLDLSDIPAKAELLKDISAVANTFHHANSNHGFLVLGAQTGGLTYTSFDQSADHLQATIDELVKHYIEPFIHTRLYQFGSGLEAWGVLVIPPTNNAPHVFVKDIQKRCRGDIYVRRGTVTDRALPGDFARFFRQHLEEHAYEQKVALRELSQRLAQLETGARQLAPDHHQVDAVNTTAVASPLSPPDLLTQIDLTLASDLDPIRTGIQREADAIMQFLRSNEVPWVMQVPSREESERLLQSLDDRCRTYWLALAKLVSLDASHLYEDTVVEALSLLACRIAAPTGQMFTEIGIGLRYYPLVVALHIVFVLGSRAKRSSLLFKCAHLTLEPAGEYDDPEHVGSALILVHRAGGVFQTQHPTYPHQQWCDPIAMRIKPLVESVAEIPRVADRFDRIFFPGEFLLEVIS
jgi:hypothetical protein